MIQTTRIHHYAIAVDDLKATAPWYGNIFGFQIERQFRFSELGIEIIHLINPADIRIELLLSQQSKPSPDLGIDMEKQSLQFCASSF
jgi:catechol 2,3-dioxygenase-like lactoylglutathione lyase family enzyme